MPPAAPVPTCQKWAQTHRGCTKQLAKEGQASSRRGFTPLRQPQGVMPAWWVVLGDRHYLFPHTRPLISGGGPLCSSKHWGQRHHVGKRGNGVAAVPQLGSLWE